MRTLRWFNKIKQFFIENSVIEDKELIVYPKMIKAVLDDIKV
eukprot:CAMPEP_0170567472 /NCGR_PEP_ID=MMETSP0211-20121228/80504_1 /TAXON_ID=311385 /ORGANISM="Pseudokeronopsis sp., Strain OXSARD2" /LENGTH=41 /DNA_ID= /DNA_START= /DNA_END= /DNA_ORIENTATION=